jgi:hypothetical protein
MMVVVDICIKCNYICNAAHFQLNFESWTSGNDDIDKFIQDTQLSAHARFLDLSYVLEWIPYSSFNNIKYIEERKEYEANWIDGRINTWDNESQNWKRSDRNMFVTLKSLIDPKNVIMELKNEV